MRVVQVAREMALARIAEDPRIGEILDVVRRQRDFLAVVLSAVRTFHTLEQLRDGRGGEGTPNLRRFLDLHTRKSGRSKRKQAEQIHRALEGLYRDEDEGNVRGALLEALVEDRLRARYYAAGCMLQNNLRFDLAEGAEIIYSSGDDSIDVIGFDGKRGECHDCKVSSRQFDGRWIAELERDVAPNGFRIGLATADYQRQARRNLMRSGIQLRGAQLIDAEGLYKLVSASTFLDRLAAALCGVGSGDGQPSEP